MTNNQSSAPKTPLTPRRKWTIADPILAVIYLAALTYIYIGFFYVDPRSGTMITVLVWGMRISWPLAGLGLLWLYAAIRTGRVPGAALALLFGSIILVALLAYPVASYLYYGRSFGHNIEQYHPFLQLTPPAYQPRDDDPGEAFRIFCLGGSTTEFTDRQKRGWPLRLEERLRNTAANPGVEVHNLGRQWYTSEHTLINYAVSLRQHRPDMIIIMHAINDLLVNADFCYYSFGPFAPDYRHFHGAAYRLINRPTLWETIISVLWKMWYHTPREIINTDEFPGLIPFERNLRTLITLARADSVQVVLLTQPYLFKESLTPEEDATLIMLHIEAVGPKKQWYALTALRGMEKYNDTVRRLAREENIPLFDLEREIPKTLEFLADDVHYQEKTFDLIAEFLADKLVANNLLPTTGPAN